MKEQPAAETETEVDEVNDAAFGRAYGRHHTLMVLVESLGGATKWWGWNARPLSARGGRLLRPSAALGGRTWNLARRQLGDENKGLLSIISTGFDIWTMKLYVLEVTLMI